MQAGSKINTIQTPCTFENKNLIRYNVGIFTRVFSQNWQKTNKNVHPRLEPDNVFFDKKNECIIHSKRRLRNRLRWVHNYDDASALCRSFSKQGWEAQGQPAIQAYFGEGAHFD